jgi:hypothetical protein
MKNFTDFLIKEDDEYGKQGGMAKSQLRMIMSAAQRLHDSLLEDDALPGHIIADIVLATDYITSAADYMESEQSEDNYDLDDMDEEAITERNDENRRKRNNEQERLGDVGYQNKGLVKRAGLAVPKGGRWSSGNCKVLGRRLQKAGIYSDHRKKNEEVELDEADGSGSKYYVTTRGNKLTHNKPFETHHDAIKHAQTEENRTRRLHTVHEITDGKINRQWQYSVGHRHFISYNDNKGKTAPKLISRNEEVELDEASLLGPKGAIHKAASADQSDREYAKQRSFKTSWKAKNPGKVWPGYAKAGFKSPYDFKEEVELDEEQNPTYHYYVTKNDMSANEMKLTHSKDKPFTSETDAFNHIVKTSGRQAGIIHKVNSATGKVVQHRGVDRGQRGYPISASNMAGDDPKHVRDLREEVEPNEEYSIKKTGVKPTLAHPDGKPTYNIIHRDEVIGKIEPYSGYSEKYLKHNPRIVSSRKNATRYSVHFHSGKGPEPHRIKSFLKNGHIDSKDALRGARIAHTEWKAKNENP